MSGSIGWGAGLQSSRLVQGKGSNLLKVLIKGNKSDLSKCINQLNSGWCHTVITFHLYIYIYIYIYIYANQIYDKLTISFNNNRKRFGMQGGVPILELYRNYSNFKQADHGEISYVYKRTAIDLGNINERLKSPWEIRKLGVTELRSMDLLT